MYKKHNPVTRVEKTVRPAAEATDTPALENPSASAPEYAVTSGNEEATGPCQDCYQHIKDTIQESVDMRGTDEDAIHQAIRQCPLREQLKGDMHMLKALRDEMSGHDLWKAYLLITFGTEANFPQEIVDIWDATKGMGTDEDKIYDALESMDSSMRKTFGLGYILKEEMSGSDLAKALGIMNQRDYTKDTIQGNLFGDPNAQEGEEQFIINPENAVELIGAEFVGAGTNSLTEAMNVLYSNETGTKEVDEALQTVANLRGLTFDQAKAQYEKAIRLRDVGRRNVQQHIEDSGGFYNEEVDDPSPDLIADNADFTATNAQLTFGKVVGDVFSIDAVFGSLMSPTGGMAGGGNERVMGVADGSAIATHGAVHDAGGYLKKAFNIGPGYDYFHNEAGSDGSHHLAGQTNIQWWIEQYEAKGIDRGTVNGPYQQFLANESIIGAAFSKDFENGGLTMSEKKAVLKIICETPGWKLNLIGVDEDMRTGEVEDMMDFSTEDDRKELAKYYNDNGGFRMRFFRSEGIDAIMNAYL